ncbi:MAG: NB-ARC domain-containing protein [Anaerolineae bacterium]|jgi:DNA-binding SARP family transcriptional activator/predicted negative regulator of RcsB-dependent stress response|nr:NB-ARC domain-containing protein [Anaerolineae bacterium]
MDRLRISLLDKVYIEKDGEAFHDFNSEPLLGLLGFLLVENGYEHSRESLIEMFWPDASETSARNQLRIGLFRIKQAFQDVLGGEALMIGSNRVTQLNPNCKPWVDVYHFQNVIERYQDEFFNAGSLSASAIYELDEALKLYKGEFLVDLKIETERFNNWLFYKREQYRQYASWANNRLLEFHEGNRNFERCLQYTRFGLIQDPWNEKLHQQHLRFLMITNRNEQAQDHFKRLQQVFVKERGIDLSEQTLQLATAIKEGSQSVAWKSHAPTSVLTKSGALTNFPPVFSFIGREHELDEINRWILNPDCRIITITGPGGVGKTQLAIQSAMNSREYFPEGIFYVPLSFLTTSRLFATNLAQILGVTSIGAKATQSLVLEALQNMRILLVLDNVSQMSTLEFFLRNIIERAPNVKLLITSRTRLNIADEWVFEIPGLEYPRSEEGLRWDDALKYSAIRLFDQQAQEHNYYKEQTGDELKEVIRICQLVAGHPLAVAMAAGWTSRITCADIADAIERRLGEIQDQHLNLPRNQSYLRAVCDISWMMLTDKERLAFEKLAIFAGGFKQEIAKQVVKTSQDELTALRAQSFIERSQKTGRYYVHPLLKEYASMRRLEENQTDPSAERDFRKRYCDYYLYFLFKRYLNILHESNHSHVYEIQYELPNIRQAWEEALYYELYEQINHALPALSMFYQRQGLLGEGLMELEPMITTLRVKLQDRNCSNSQMIYFTLANLLVEKSNFLFAQNAVEMAKRAVEQANEYAISSGRPLAELRCAYQFARLYLESNYLSRAVEKIEQTMALISEGGFDFDPEVMQVWVARAFELYGDILVRQEQYEDAKEKFQRAKFLFSNSDLRMLSKSCNEKIDNLSDLLGED